jgi:hypothetical protein
LQCALSTSASLRRTGEKAAAIVRTGVFTKWIEPFNTSKATGNSSLGAHLPRQFDKKVRRGSTQEKSTNPERLFRTFEPQMTKWERTPWAPDPSLGSFE